MLALCAANAKSYVVDFVSSITGSLLLFDVVARIIRRAMALEAMSPKRSPVMLSEAKHL
jgi:hypothetical protein